MRKLYDPNYKTVIKNILDLYYSKIQKEYMPALIEEGVVFSSNPNDSNDIYIKLIAVPNVVTIDKTWYLDNLSAKKENDAFNFVVGYKMMRQNIYGVHPDLLSNHTVSFCKQESDSILDVEYIDLDHRAKRMKALKDEDNRIYILSDLVRSFTGKSDYSFNEYFDLYIDFEYREYTNIKPKFTGIKKTKNYVIDITYQEPTFNKNKGELYWIRGTVKLDINRIFEINDSSVDFKDLAAFDISSGKVRKINLENYDDDINAGLIVFSNEAIDFIKKYYFFYDLYLIPKKEEYRKCLIDVFDEYVVFWEGEFNSKLPYELKKEIVKFNLDPSGKKLLNQAMYESQLMARWDIYKFLLPNQQLANRLLETKYEISFETGIDFYPPINNHDFSVFINNCLKILNMTVNDLPISNDNKNKLLSILEEKYEFIDKDDLYNNYQGLCIFFLNTLGFEYDE